jgi:glycosyltransferase involved in cell wall biosynthesis
MNIIAICRVYNGGKYLKKYLDQMSRLADKILILDDGSTDNSFSICKTYPKVEIEHISHTAHEGLMSNYLYNWAGKYNPNWIICLDVDEVFVEKYEEDVKKLCEGFIEGYSFPLLYLWDKENEYRVDGVYGNIKAIRLYRYQVGKTPFVRRCHSLPVPESVNVIESSIPILHYGYLDKEERWRKYNYYLKLDDGNYNHIVSENIEVKRVEEFGGGKND